VESASSASAGDHYRPSWRIAWRRSTACRGGREQSLSPPVHHGVLDAERRSRSMNGPPIPFAMPEIDAYACAEPIVRAYCTWRNLRPATPGDLLVGGTLVGTISSIADAGIGTSNAPRSARPIRGALATSMMSASTCTAVLACAFNLRGCFPACRCSSVVGGRISGMTSSILAVRAPVVGQSSTATRVPLCSCADHPGAQAPRRGAGPTAGCATDRQTVSRGGAYQSED